MAGDWTKVTNDIEDKREVVQIAGLTGLDPDAVIGKLVRIWIWASEQTIDGYVRGVTVAFIDQKARHPGFAAAMKVAEWLEEDKAGILFPNFDRHMSESAKKRALAAIRMANARSSRCAEVTPAAQRERNEKRTRSSLLLSTLSRSKKGGPGGAPAAAVAFPAQLDTPECRAAWAEWLDHKAARRESYKTIKSQQIKLNQLAEIGPARFVAAVYHSIGNNWAGIYEPKGAGAPRTNFEKNMAELARLEAEEAKS